MKPVNCYIEKKFFGMRLFASNMANLAEDIYYAYKNKLYLVNNQVQPVFVAANPA